MLAEKDLLAQNEQLQAQKNHAGLSFHEFFNAGQCLNGSLSAQI